MRHSSKTRKFVICACLGAAIYSPSGFATRVAASASTGRDPAADEQVGKRVEAALHSDPYFNDGHVTVSMENGDVVLDGFVLGAWDLLDAIRIARRVAGGRRVVDNLSIEVGGRK
jgi:osmotically-inducible protein OsmY